MTGRPDTPNPEPAVALARPLSAPAPELSFVIVVVALVLLLVLPLLVRRRSDAIRLAATEIAEPARDLAEDIERDFAIQLAAAPANTLSTDPRQRAHFRAAAADARSALDRLAPLAASLGSESAAAANELRAALLGWEAGVTDGQGGPPADTRRAAEARGYEATIEAAARLDSAIGRAEQRRREEARRTDALAASMNAVLLVLVLASVVLLARLAQQLRRLAQDAAGRAREEEALRRELERTMESRARLIRGFSHDVRNPLGAADGYAQLLQGGVHGALNEWQVQSVSRLRASIGAAVLLIDDLLDLARFEAGQLEVEHELLDARTLLGDVAEEYRAQAETAGLVLTVELPAGELHLHSDQRRVRQVLGNLVSNAIKYTPAGGRLALRLKASSADGGPRPGEWAVVEVEDTGPGIAPQQRARIFDEFARLDPSAARGAGLGLTISLRLARALGGEITLISEPGQGSTFTLWLPRDAQDLTRVQPGTARPSAGSG